jgi:hypothetical protein
VRIALDAAIATHVGAVIARFPFTKAQVSQVSNRLRRHVDIAGDWPLAVGNPVGVPKAEAALRGAVGVPKAAAALRGAVVPKTEATRCLSR